VKQQYITLSSFRSDLLEMLIQFSEEIDDEYEEAPPSRTEKDWWEEFKEFVESA